MEAVIFIGVQGIGKSTFYYQHFFKTHMRINLDMLKTRHREKLLTQACLEAKQSFVSDNTNVTREVRARTIMPARDAGFRIIGYYFRASIMLAIERNRTRPEADRLLEKAIAGTYKRLELPAYSEGFDQLYYVQPGEQDYFSVEVWQDEI